MGFILDERHHCGDDAPGEHDAGQPDTCADFLQQHVGGHLEQRVADEEQACAQSVGGSADTQVMFHVRAHETDIDPVDVVEDEHDHEKREHMSLYFAHGPREI
ncbi:hypothetical protein D3C78_1462750 [compost metagenome]